MAKPADIKTNAVRDVVAGQSRRQTARKYRVHIVTLSRWLKLFREAGSDLRKFEFDCRYHRPHNRFDHNQEQIICEMKERQPGITLARARHKLRQAGIDACPATIRRVWLDAGYLDLVPGSPQAPPFTRPNTARLLLEARRILETKGPARQAGLIVNGLPACTDLKTLTQIPDRYLSLRRRLEKLDAMRSIAPMQVYYRRCRKVRAGLEKRKYYCSMLQAGFAEASALSWLNHPKEGLALINHLSAIVPGRLSRYLRFKLLFYQGRFYADMLLTKQAVDCARHCRLLLKSLHRHDLQTRLSQLYSSLGEYGKARKTLEKAMTRAGPNITDDDRISQAVYCAINGDYNAARGIINKLAEPADNFKSIYYITLAACELGSGNPERALESSQKALIFAQREGFINFLQASIIVQASAYAALGFTGQALKGIRKIMPLLAKHQVKRDHCIHAMLLGDVRVTEPSAFPPVKLLVLLKKAGRSGKISDYNAAYTYAHGKGLLGIFHRYCLLAPAAVNRLVSQAKTTHLPRSILRQPVFNRELPSFRVDFLGPFRFYRNEQPVKTRLRPKDAAFFTHLLMARASRLEVDACLANFWPSAADPRNSLYHLLRRLRQSLAIPTQYLYVQEQAVHYTGSGITDYKLFEESLSLARTLTRGQEPVFAQQEYQRAFMLLRGEPFRAIYDRWSDDLRFRILSRVETAAADYAAVCVESGSAAAEAARMIAAVLRIMPGSDTCAKSLQTLQALCSKSTETD